MTNAESVDDSRILVGRIFAMLDITDSGVNGIKFITLAAVPYPAIFERELRDARCKFLSWKFNVGNWQRNS